MYMDPIAREVMMRLEASGRPNVRMDAYGNISWDDPTNPTGARHLTPDMFDDALVRLAEESTGRVKSLAIPSYPQPSYTSQSM